MGKAIRNNKSKEKCIMCHIVCCYKCGMPIYKVVLREKVKYLLNELWGTCDMQGQSCKESMKCDTKRLYIAMTERIWNVSHSHDCQMYIWCIWHVIHVIFFVTLHKNNT